MAGQVRTTDFPEAWHQVRDILEEDEGDYQVLFLPWHMYMTYSWLPTDDKALANPAPLFFGTKVIAGDNIEFGVFSQSVDPVSGYVELLLSQSADLDNFGELVAPLNVRYIILVDEADYRDYAFLDRQKDLRVAFEKPGITLFQNTYPYGRAYAVDDVVVLGSLGELVEISRREDILSHVYVLEPKAESTDASHGLVRGPEFPPVQRTHAGRYRVAETSRPYTVFVTKYGTTSRHWRLGGQGPDLMNLGMMPTFRSDGDVSTISLSRWTWLLAIDGLSLFVAVVSAVYLLWPGVSQMVRKKLGLER